MTWASVDAAGAHACARTDQGVAYCWGTDGSGQLGDGATAPVAPGPVRVLY